MKFQVLKRVFPDILFKMLLCFFYFILFFLYRPIYNSSIPPLRLMKWAKCLFVILDVKIVNMMFTHKSFVCNCYTLLKLCDVGGGCWVIIQFGTNQIRAAASVLLYWLAWFHKAAWCTDLASQGGVCYSRRLIYLSVSVRLCTSCAFYFTQTHMNHVKSGAAQ